LKIGTFRQVRVLVSDRKLRPDSLHTKYETEARRYRSAGEHEGKVALINGDDSGIGKSVAIHSPKQALISPFRTSKKTKDAARTRTLLEREGRRCLLLRGDVGDRNACDEGRPASDKTFRTDLDRNVCSHCSAGCRRRISLAIDAAAGKRNPRQRGGAGSNLDAGHPRDFQARTQPDEVASCYVFLASDDANCIRG
jgi:hypothetical protein